MKSEYKRIIVYIILAIVVPLLAYYGQLFIPESEEERKSHELYHFQLSLDWFNRDAKFELFFSRYVIEKWVNDKKLPSAEEAYKYIKTLDLTNSKNYFANAMSESSERYNDISIYNSVDSLLVISEPKKLKEISLLHKIKDEEIYVIAFLPLEGLLKSSKLFTSPKGSAFYFSEDIKECYPQIYDNYLKWIPASQAKKLFNLYKTNYTGFVEKWKKTKTLLNYDLFYPYDPYDPKNSEKGFYSQKDIQEYIRSNNITALYFVIDYFKKNHNKVEAFIKDLASENK